MKDKEKSNLTNINTTDGSQNPIVEEDKDTKERLNKLQKDIKAKENLIKELRNQNDKMKQEINKLQEENYGLVEKSKINKIDMSRKDSIIKELKERSSTSTSEIQNPYINISGQEGSINKSNNSQLTNNILAQTNDKNIEKLKENNKKLKQDIERKDNYISTLKAKADQLTKDLDEIKAANNRLKQYSSIDNQSLQVELEKVFKKNYKLQLTVEQLKSLARRIIKDLISTTDQAKRYKTHDEDQLKEGLSILKINQDELNEFILGSQRSVQQVEEMINAEDEIDVEGLMETYTMLKEKLIDMAGEMKLLPETQKKYTNFAKCVDENSKLIFSNNKPSKTKHNKLEKLDSLIDDLRSINKIN